MVDEERDAQAEPEAKPIAKKSRLGLFLILGIVLVVLVGAILGLLMFAPGVVPFLGEKPADQTTADQTASGKEKTKEPETLGIMYAMEPYIVNLVDPNVQRYLKLKLELELSNAKVQSEIDLRMPQIRDSILVLLSSKSFNDIKTVEGKMRLRMEIIGRINSFLSEGRVKNVYFTEFVVQ